MPAVTVRGKTVIGVEWRGAAAVSSLVPGAAGRRSRPAAPGRQDALAGTPAANALLSTANVLSGLLSTLWVYTVNSEYCTGCDLVRSVRSVRPGSPDEAAPPLGE